MALDAHLGLLERDAAVLQAPGRRVRHLDAVTLLAPHLHVVALRTGLAGLRVGVEMHRRLAQTRRDLLDLSMAVLAVVRSRLALMAREARHHHGCGGVEVPQGRHVTGGTLDLVVDVRLVREHEVAARVGLARDSRGGTLRTCGTVLPTPASARPAPNPCPTCQRRARPTLPRWRCRWCPTRRRLPPRARPRQARMQAPPRSREPSTPIPTSIATRRRVTVHRLSRGSGGSDGTRHSPPGRDTGCTLRASPSRRPGGPCPSRPGAAWACRDSSYRGRVHGSSCTRRSLWPLLQGRARSSTLSGVASPPGGTSGRTTSRGTETHTCIWG